MDDLERQGEQYYYRREFKQRVTCNEDDFDVSWHDGDRPEILIVAPHGGAIEPWTPHIAQLIADKLYASCYVFRTKVKSEALIAAKQPGCPEGHPFHIASEGLYAPHLRKMLRRALVCVSVHGCRSQPNGVQIGGLARDLGDDIRRALAKRNIRAEMASTPELSGTCRSNFVNGAQLQMGVQLEIGGNLRTEGNGGVWNALAAAVAEAVEAEMPRVEAEVQRLALQDEGWHNRRPS